MLRAGAPGPRPGHDNAHPLPELHAPAGGNGFSIFSPGGGAAPIIAPMEWLVSLALLVAVCSWVVATYHRLHHLRSQVQEAWLQWELSTRQRNACLHSFAPAFEHCAPPSLELPHELRHAAQDSDHELDFPLPPPLHEAHALPTHEFLKPLGEHERSLRILVGDSLRILDELPGPPQDGELPELVSRLSASLFRQEQVTQLYNRAVEDYNAALASPSGRLVGSAFRLSEACSLSTW